MLNHFESRHAKSVYAGVVISKEKMMECQQKRGMNTSRIVYLPERNLPRPLSHGLSLHERNLPCALSHGLSLCACLLEQCRTAHHWQLGPRVDRILIFAAGPTFHHTYHEIQAEW